MGFSKLPAVIIFAAAVVAMMMVALGARVADAQTPSCVEKLVPCAEYLNSTATPPASCCGPIGEVMANETEMQCVCNLYNAPALLESFGINIAQVTYLPGRCNLDVLSTCGEGHTLIYSYHM